MRLETKRLVSVAGFEELRLQGGGKRVGSGRPKFQLLGLKN